MDPPRADVVAAFHAADLFVFGSNIECSPLVLFEAMASKTPFITNACGNAEEIIKWGNGGILVPSTQDPRGYVNTDPNIMACHIEELIENPNKRLLLAESGYNAWKEQFTWEKIAINYEKIYQTLVNKPQKYIDSQS